MAADEPDVRWEDLQASAVFRELFRFTKGDLSEAYYLRVVTSRAELWQVTYRGEVLGQSVKLHTFASPQEALTFVQAMRDRLPK